MTLNPEAAISRRPLRRFRRRSRGNRIDAAIRSLIETHDTVSETGETRTQPRTYRELARLVGCSPATVWRDLNRGRLVTLTKSMRSQRFALVLFYRGQGLSIRRIASELATSRGTVERELRRARRLTEHGFDVIETTRRTIADGLEREGSR